VKPSKELPFLDALADADDNIEIILAKNIVGKHTLYVHVNGQTVARVGGIVHKEQVSFSDETSLRVSGKIERKVVADA